MTRIEAAAAPVPVGRRVVDHDLHGLVRLRLLDPPDAVLASVRRELGPSAGSAAPSAEPDVVVDFVDAVPVSPGLRWLNAGEAAYDDQRFYLSTGRRPELVEVDVSRLGTCTRLTAPRTARCVPLLVQLVGLHLLASGHVLLHASAFRHHDRTVLVAGWKKGGKTEVLLPFLAAGAQYLSDEWTVVGADGSVRGVAGAMHLWNWHVEQFDELWAALPRGTQRRFRALRRYQQLDRAVPALSRGDGFVPRHLRELARDGGLAAAGQVRVDPEELFPGRVRHAAAPLDRLVLASATPGPLAVQQVAGAQVARRMVASLAYEREPLVTAYQQYRFAFPDQRNPLLESTRERELAVLASAFRGIPAVEVRHPYPLPLRQLREALEPWIG